MPAVAWAAVFQRYVAACPLAAEQRLEELEATSEEFADIAACCGARAACHLMLAFSISANAYLATARLGPHKPSALAPSSPNDTNRLEVAQEPAPFTKLRALSDLRHHRRQWSKITFFLRALAAFASETEETLAINELVLSLQDMLAVTGHWETEAQRRRRMDFDTSD